VTRAARLPEFEAEPLHLTVSASPRSLGEVRRALEGLGLSELTLRDAVLLTTELVSNSVRHAGLDPDDLIEVHVDRGAGRLRVSVRDGGSWVPPDGVAGSIRPFPGAESGWGLYLVERLAVRWGTHRGGGVWFELEEQAPGGRTA
jgi:anti-sigma regulatory factor (Ser/Thr protein kinase)